MLGLQELATKALCMLGKHSTTEVLQLRFPSFLPFSGRGMRVLLVYILKAFLPLMHSLCISRCKVCRRPFTDPDSGYRISGTGPSVRGGRKNIPPLSNSLRRRPLLPDGLGISIPRAVEPRHAGCTLVSGRTRPRRVGLGYAAALHLLPQR